MVLCISTAMTTNVISNIHCWIQTQLSPCLTYCHSFLPLLPSSGLWCLNLLPFFKSKQSATMNRGEQLHKENCCLLAQWTPLKFAPFNGKTRIWMASLWIKALNGKPGQKPRDTSKILLFPMTVKVNYFCFQSPPSAARNLPQGLVQDGREWGRQCLNNTSTKNAAQDLACKCQTTPSFTHKHTRKIAKLIFQLKQ